MNIINKRFLGLAFLAVVLMTQTMSCKKFLDVQPRDYMFDKEAFSTKEGVASVMNGIYLGLSDSLLYGNLLTLNITEQMGQYYYPSGGTYGSNLANLNWGVPALKPLFQTIWSKAYREIIAVNTFCHFLEDPDYEVLTAQEKNLLLGEAYALRAFLHFDLLRLYGPIYTTGKGKEAIPYYKKAEPEIMPLLNADSVVTMLLEDLELALNFLENDPVRTMGPNRGSANSEINYFSSARHRRMNYVATQALYARVLLYAGMKSEAYTQAKAIIDGPMRFFPWQSGQQMQRDPLLSKESLFGIENRRLYDYHRSMFAPFLKDNMIYAPTPARLDVIYPTTNTDLRRTTWFKLGTEGGKSYQLLNKYNPDLSADAAVKYYQPLIRSAEVYLIAAESAPDLSEGYNYLNKVRLARALPELEFGSSSNITVLTNAISDEYIREFVGEGQTFFMYKRLNLRSLKGALGASNIFMTDTKYKMPMPEDEMYYR